MPEKVLDSKPYAWERPGFDIKSLFDYKQACETSAMMVMRRTLFEQIDVLRQKRKDIRIIDGGCGCGRWVIYLNRKGFNCVGVDAN
ncbi:MAG: class I SAM-dependent methyltransferase, partial [Candidatus Margulisbacteria bacterium]|nr:class I SAM-dependent methyltransferase [Candidatus Margulisiibacteriota bacterium]